MRGLLVWVDVGRWCDLKWLLWTAVVNIVQFERPNIVQLIRLKKIDENIYVTYSWRHIKKDL